MTQGAHSGKGRRECRRCHTHRAVIRRYGLNLCRRCFYEIGKVF